MPNRAVKNIKIELWDGTILKFDLSKGQGFLQDFKMDTPPPKPKKGNQLQLEFIDYEIHWTTYKEE